MHPETVANHRRSQLEALAIARKECTVHSARTARWFVLAGVVFIGLWAAAGYTIAIYTACASAVLRLALLSTGIGSVRQTEASRRASAIATTIELDLLQDAIDDGARELRVTNQSPITAEQVRAARVIRREVDAVAGHRGVMGLQRGSLRCTAGYVEATDIVEVRLPRKPMKREYIRVFSGIIAVIDHPGTRGWVTLTPTDSVSIAGMIDAVLPGDDPHAIHVHHPELERRFTLRGSSADDVAALLTPTLVHEFLAFGTSHGGLPATFGMHEGSITVSIPMPQNPFQLNDNPDRWEAELQRCTAAARALSALFDALCAAAAPARLREAS